MKIALLSTFFPFRGGIAQFGAKLYRSLEEKGHEVKAYTFKTQYPNFLFPGKTQFVKEDDKADAIPAIRSLSSVNPLSFRKTSRQIVSEAPDLFITQYWMTFFAPALGFVSKKMSKNAKSIAILHNVIPHEGKFYDSWANKYFLKQHQGFVVMSDIVQNDLLSIKPDAKFLRIDHPVYDHFGAILDKQEAIKKLGLDGSKKYLLFFGFIRDYKGLDLLIDALGQLDESYELIIAGEVYGSFKKYEDQIKVGQLEKRIHLYNQYITDEEVSPFFSAADLCVLPYKSATQSGITAIAHHFETPIIATNVGGLKETIGNTGIVVENSDAGSIKSAINSFYDGNMGEFYRNNIREIKEKNSWSNFAEALLEFAETI